MQAVINLQDWQGLREHRDRFVIAVKLCTHIFLPVFKQGHISGEKA